MLAEQVRFLARQCAEDTLRGHREGRRAGELDPRPDAAAWEALRELLEVAGEPARGTAEHDRFLYAERVFVETYGRVIREGGRPTRRGS
jgi:hypothetical protein